MTNQVHIYRTLPTGSSSAIVSLMDESRGERRHFRIIWEGQQDIPAFWWDSYGEFSCPKAFVKCEIFYPHPPRKVA